VLPAIPRGMPVMEVDIVITVFTVDAALQHTCALFRERASQGDITPMERDLLIDGAILLAMHLDEVAQSGRIGPSPGWSEAARPGHSGRHERQVAAAAA
jgi:hypothetical protein